MSSQSEKGKQTAPPIGGNSASDRPNPLHNFIEGGPKIFDLHQQAVNGLRFSA